MLSKYLVVVDVRMHGIFKRGVFTEIVDFTYDSVLSTAIKKNSISLIQVGLFRNIENQ